MMKRKKRKKYLLFNLAILGGVLLPVCLFAGSSSSSFTIQNSVISGGGGAMSSDSFRSNGTVGQSTPIMDADDIPSPPESTTFKNFPGFHYTLEAEAGCPDTATFALTFGLTSADPGYNIGCDFDKDNDVDGVDLTAFSAP